MNAATAQAIPLPRGTPPGPGEPHQHIDLIYFCRPIDGGGQDPALGDFHWLDEEALRSNRPLHAPSRARQGARLGGVSAPIADDVRLLALRAIEAARALTAGDDA